MEYRTFVHESREENLLAAKKAVRTNRKTIMMRHTGQEADVIDIMSGRDIVERHVCRTGGAYPQFRAGAYADGAYWSGRRQLFVEGLALYQ